jgi:hypothetical protein
MSLTGIRLPLLAVLIVVLGTSGSLAQNAGPDELVRPDGVVSQKLELTPLQRIAIYNAVARRPGRTATPQLAATVGAPVPPSVMLRDLPDQAAIETAEAQTLKYAIVEDDVVVVDPIQMRVVDVIRGARR